MGGAASRLMVSCAQVSRVIFVVFSKKDEEVYHAVVPEYFPGPSPNGKA